MNLNQSVCHRMIGPRASILNSQFLMEILKCLQNTTITTVCIINEHLPISYLRCELLYLIMLYDFGQPHIKIYVLQLFNHFIGRLGFQRSCDNIFRKVTCCNQYVLVAVRSFWEITNEISPDMFSRSVGRGIGCNFLCGCGGRAAVC